jgi:hypothetical protein
MTRDANEKCRDEKCMNPDRKPRNLQWCGGILSYATASMLNGSKIK